MSVTAVDEIVGDRGCTLSIDGTRRYTREFIVQTNSVSDGALTVATATGIPILGSVYSFGSELDLATCQSIDPRPLDDDALTWIVRLTYLFDPKQSQQPPPEEGPPNPFLKPALYAFATDPKEEVFKRDLDGNKVCNSTGQPFDPPATIPSNNWKCVVTKNVPFIGGGFITQWDNTVNDSSFQGIPAKRLWLSSITATPVEDAFWGPYHQLTLEFSYNSKRDWEPVEILDAGLYQFDDIIVDEDFLVPCVDRYNREVSEAVRLDGSGFQLLDKDAEDVYRKFRAFRLVDFSGLGL